MLNVLVVILLSVAVVFYVGYPLIFKREDQTSGGGLTSVDEPHLRELLRKKENIYLAIKELEFDYKMGKLSEGDYQQLKERLKRDATLILQHIDEIEVSQYGESLDDQIEKEILAFRKKKKIKVPVSSLEAPSETKCPNCYKLLNLYDKFCSECGTRVQLNCESCGQTYAVVHKFCPSCGNKLVSSL